MVFDSKEDHMDEDLQLVGERWLRGEQAELEAEQEAWRTQQVAEARAQVAWLEHRIVELTWVESTLPPGRDLRRARHELEKVQASLEEAQSVLGWVIRWVVAERRSSFRVVR